jgi:hypothetical protein
VLGEHHAVVRTAGPELLHRPGRIAHDRDLRAPKPQDAAGEGGDRGVGLDEQEVHARQRALHNMTAA